MKTTTSNVKVKRRKLAVVLLHKHVSSIINRRFIKLYNASYVVPENPLHDNFFDLWIISVMHDKILALLPKIYSFVKRVAEEISDSYFFTF